MTPTAFELLAAIGFEGDALLSAAAVGYGESEGFTDAVGDIELARLGPYATEALAMQDLAARKAAGRPFPNPAVFERVDDSEAGYLVNTKWGPSVGWFQVRALDDPFAWGIEDEVRVAEKLRDSLYSAHAAFVISKGGTDWAKWSVYRSGKYKDYLNLDYQLRTGHPKREHWSD